MRQADDPDFQSFLDRVRATCITQDDITRLNSKVVTSIFDPRLHTATVVVKRNSTRQAINRARLWHFDTRDACNDTGECVYTDGPSKWNHGHCY